jgi:LuxR family quorum-sensing system transcriptional regulator CciR
MAAAELIGAHAFDAARRLASLAGPVLRPHLSPREIQCLRLVAAGQTDWEISVILGISVETARQYVKHARRTYRVLSRTQLVVLGLRDDWLSFEEALDPRIDGPPLSSCE